METLGSVEGSPTARFTETRDQYRALTRKALLRRDKERYVMNFTEDIECHLNANEIRPAYRTLTKLLSKSTSQMNAI